MTNKKCKKWIILTGILGVSCILLYISFYKYYTDTIKQRPFPEDGRLSPSGCYVTKRYYIEQEDSFIIALLYNTPAFIKVFDDRTKQCVYTSNIYPAEYLAPLIEFDDKVTYGFLSINTDCENIFIHPEEFEENK